MKKKIIQLLFCAKEREIEPYRPSGRKIDARNWEIYPFDEDIIETGCTVHSKHQGYNIVNE